MRDEDALYHTKANFFPADLLSRILRGARATYGIDYISFTGGEVTLHPRFAEIVAVVAAEEMQLSFVTNGWHFERVLPALIAHKQAVRVVAFSVDGATREAHDFWRGAGSFDRVISAVTRCNVDWRGRLTLCCNMAGFRNADGEPDVVADLTREDFGVAYVRLQAVARAQVERRRAALAAYAEQGSEPDLYTGSPCLFCLQSFGKIPWRSARLSGANESNGRAL